MLYNRAGLSWISIDARRNLAEMSIVELMKEYIHWALVYNEFLNKSSSTSKALMTRSLDSLGSFCCEIHYRVSSGFMFLFFPLFFFLKFLEFDGSQTRSRFKIKYIEPLANFYTCVSWNLYFSKIPYIKKNECDHEIVADEERQRNRFIKFY